MSNSHSSSVIQAAGFKTGSSGTQLNLVKKGTVSVVVAALTAAAEADVSVTISGAAAGDIILMTPLDAAMETGLGIAAIWVSAANTVKIRMSNFSGSTLTGSTSNWSYLLIQS